MWSVTMFICLFNVVKKRTTVNLNKWFVLFGIVKDCIYICSKTVKIELLTSLMAKMAGEEASHVYII